MDAAHHVHGLRRSTSNIRVAAERAAKIVFALKSYAHPGSSEGEALSGSIAENLETVTTLYHNQIKLGVNLVNDYRDRGEVVARHDELNQVWTNLLHNALQAIEHHGQIELRVEGDEGHDDNLRLDRVGDRRDGGPEGARDHLALGGPAVKGQALPLSRHDGHAGAV